MTATIRPDQRGAYLALICFNPDEPESGDPEDLFALLSAFGANGGSNTVRCELITHATTGTTDAQNLRDAFDAFTVLGEMP
jgi:hypothetical protein